MGRKFPIEFDENAEVAELAYQDFKKEEVGEDDMKDEFDNLTWEKKMDFDTQLRRKLEKCYELRISVPIEMFDFLDILISGAEKREADNWLKANGQSVARRDMYASMCRHSAEFYMGETRDKDSGQHPCLHLATRALMCYTRSKKGLIHEDDE